MTGEPCICSSLRRAAHASSEFYDAALAPSGLKVTMYRLMKTVRGNEDLTLTGLAAKLDLDRSTLGRNLTVLERRGLVRRTGLKDERASGVELTEAGASALRAAEPLWREAQDRMHRRLDGAAGELLGLLRRVED